MRGTELPAQVCFDCLLSNLLLLFPVLKLRSGPAAGSSVPLASIVVTDQSGVEMKVVLWRRAAFWVLTVCPGDVLLITGTMWQQQARFTVIGRIGTTASQVRRPCSVLTASPGVDDVVVSLIRSAGD